MRSDELKEYYHLQQHPEGGWFAETYTAPFSADGRPMAGSIFFLLDAGEISHFHQVDCDEIWYFQEGCGIKITVLLDGKKDEHLLGPDFAAGQSAMAVIRKGAVFAAENLISGEYSLVSCVTIPRFSYEGFRLVGKDEIQKIIPDATDEVIHLAF